MPAGSQTVRVLEADPELAEGLDPESRATATRDAVARVQALRPGRWEAEAQYGRHIGFLGLLVLDGLLTREVSLGSQISVELLGPGDLLRPWDHDGGYDIPAVEVVFEVVEPTRLAVLDDRFEALIGRWPSIAAAIVGRLGRRSRWLAVRVAISQLHRVDTRLLFLLWHLAERWGRVAPEGIVVSLPLTHDRLGALVGARRPSVSTALAQLSERGLLSRRPDGDWVLTGDAPDALGRALGD